MTKLSTIAAIDDELLCPICGYNLRGLVEHRCPECGHPFDPAALRRAQRELHPYLFEHHPERNIRSLARTLIGGINPFKFWSVLQPVHAIIARRIVVYWLLITVAATSLAIIPFACRISFDLGAMRALSILGPGAWNALQHLVHSMARSTLVPSLLYLIAWPWFTIAAFAIFRVTLGRAKIRFGHVMRVSIYAFDSVVWFALAMAIIAPFADINHFLFDVAIPLATTAVALIASARLLIAAKLYLNFRQSVTMAVLTQIIVLGPLAIYWAAAIMFRIVLGRW